METFLSQLIFGIQRGTVYALIALGYTMVYGVVRLINFAYGEVFMLGAFISFFLIQMLQLPPVLNIIMALLVPMALCSILGLAMDSLAYKPLRSKPRLAALITAIGVSFFLSNLVSYIGAESVRTVSVLFIITALVVVLFTLSQKLFNFPKVTRYGGISMVKRVVVVGSLGLLGFVFWIAKPALAELRWKGSSFTAFPVDKLFTVVKYPVFGSVYITNVQIIIIIVSVALMVGLSILVNRTMLGMAMRASKNNKEAVSLMGINVNSVIAFTFAIGTALAGAAGVLSAVTYPRITAFMGIQPGLKAFIAAVLGGIGSIEGAMVGGIIMGLAEQFAIGLAPSSFGPNNIDFTPLAEGVSFAILIIVLLLRPQGIFGEPPQDKV
ncbi:MAG: branched-chain amino acid ABC transporter permease [Spirochaetes bacterium]|nr:branched-chain amino acid ABC transporter permease [Spirochaetota bacterium]